VEKVGKVEGWLDLAKSVNMWKKAQYTDICRWASELRDWLCVCRSLMMPGFVDCHTHAVSYLLAGLRSKFDCMSATSQSTSSTGGNNNGLNERRVRTMNVIANDKHALSLFTTYVVQLLAYFIHGLPGLSRTNSH